MERRILHIDVNNAFLSWTAVAKLKQGEKLDIRTIPSIIGGDETQRKGIVLAKSNIAKQFGIKTGEPIYAARKKCPNIQIFPSNFSIYYNYSNQLHELFAEYTDEIEQFSIDECFLDMTHFVSSDEMLLKKAYEINKRVKEELGFTVNIGVAHNKLLAKMASDFTKPDKVHTLWEKEIRSKMWNLSVAELFMVGKKSIPKLEKMRIKTIGDLANFEKQEMIKKFGKFGKMIWEYANGIDLSPVEYKQEKPKGIGNSVTLPYDYSDIQKIEEVLLALTEQVTYRLRKQEMLATVVNVQIKTNEFKVYSHQRKMDIATDSTKLIYQEAKRLLEHLYKGTPIRLLGIRVDNLCEKEERQLSLFDSKEKKRQEKIDETMDELKAKYGTNVVTRAGKMKIDSQMQVKD